MRFVFLSLSVTLLSFQHSSAVAAEPSPVRVGAVAIRDHAGRSIGFSALDARMVSQLKKAGLQAVTLPFRPAADMDHAARQAKCDYILYTDILDIRKTAGSQISDKVKDAGESLSGNQSSKSRDTWEAEIEFRLFAIDQVAPLLSSSVNGKNTRSKPGSTPPAPADTTSVLSVADANILTEATPQEETGRQKKHKSVAVAAALEREVKMVKERIRNPPREQP